MDADAGLFHLSLDGNSHVHPETVAFTKRSAASWKIGCGPQIRECTRKGGNSGNMDTERGDKNIGSEKPPQDAGSYPEDGQELAIPVNLYREEYIRFSETVFRLQNRRRRMWRGFGDFPSSDRLHRTAADRRGWHMGEWNYSLFFFVILMAAGSGFLFVGWPLLIRRSAGKATAPARPDIPSTAWCIYITTGWKKVTASGRAVIHFGKTHFIWKRQT